MSLKTEVSGKDKRSQPVLEVNLKQPVTVCKDLRIMETKVALSKGSEHCYVVYLRQWKPSLEICMHSAVSSQELLLVLIHSSRLESLSYYQNQL